MRPISADANAINNILNAGRGPCRLLGDFTIVPSVNIAFQCDLAILDRDANGLGIQFRIAGKPSILSRARFA